MRLLLKLLLAVAVLFLAAFTGGGLYLSSGKVLAERHEPFVPPETFDFDSGSYADYLAWTRTLLREARPDAPDSVIANLSPFRLEPGPECARTDDGRHRRGVLLTHGLIDSPYSMRHLGEDLRARCFLVYGLLLPGHGTRPGDLLKAGWEDWARAQHFATAQLAGEAEQVVLAGHSAGGALAILEASANPDVDGLMLFAPALGISESAKYAYVADWFGLLFPGAAWHGVREDAAVYRYESLTYHSAAETWELIEATWQAQRERPLLQPVLTVASQEDTTVSTPAILEFMALQTHPASRTLLYSQEALDGLPDEVRVLPSRDEAQGVLSVSHLGLMTPPEHPHYGRDGAYRYCGHYEDEPASLAACREGKREFYGEGTPANRERGLVERIAFNPWYDSLLGELEGFLAELP